ncbi:AEC family transporter [Romboutsia sp.]|uniref:AEC family transporter n=1 Tax=Romboutsia sp. TaxID=1965302 RepID=UPI003F39104E
MQNLILSFNVVLPLFIIMSLGYFIKKLKMFNETTLATMNSITFKVFLPTLLFYNVYNTDFKTLFNPQLIIFTSISVLTIFGFLCILIPFIEKDNKKRGVIIQAIFRSNFVIFGIPVATSLFGENATGVASMLIAVIVPLFNILSVIILEVYRGGKIDTKKIFKGVISNPLIIAAAFGLILIYLDIKLPSPIEKSVSDISKIATPLALILLGGSFKLSQFKKYGREIFIGVIGRLVIVPSVVIPLAIYYGFRDIELTCLLSVFASPTAVASFTMAQQMDGDSDLAGQIVVFTSGLCVLSVFLWIFILKELTLI